MEEDLWRRNPLSYTALYLLEEFTKISTLPLLPGAVAQLIEHLICNQGVRGLNPLSSTTMTLY